MERYALAITWVNHNGEEREQYDDNDGYGYCYENAISIKKNLCNSNLVRIENVELVIM